MARIDAVAERFPTARTRPTRTAAIVGLLAVGASVAYFVSDLIEVLEGGFSTGQLWLTLAAEAAIPVFVIGLALLHRPGLGRIGLISAMAYAYAFAVFTGTVVYALVEHTPDFDALRDDLEPLIAIHGAVMVLAGVGFGFAVYRARQLPRWTGATLAVGDVFVAATSGQADWVQLIAAGVRDVGFAGMGAAVSGDWRPWLRRPAARSTRAPDEEGLPPRRTE